MRSFLKTLLLSAAGALLLGTVRQPDLPRSVIRAQGDRFEIVTSSGARPVFFRGVSMGAAPPGHFPGEFAITKNDYHRWIRFARGLRANAIRLYALHPPAFYQALKEENEAHPDSVIWLFQEVWTELPESNDFFDPAFDRGFRGEISLAINAIHGYAKALKRPGHASGEYLADVSPWLAGWILGREWEPFAVRETQRKHPDSTRFRGTYFAVDGGTAMEVWLAKICDYAASLEAERWRLAHAVSFVNWPTLDPMRHPTETEPGGGEAEHDEDAYSVDPTRIRPIREASKASRFLGYFANYHAYPYYPDFINLDPGYARHRDRHGLCNYAGYLADLKAHTRGLPLLIGEYGVPSSRGIAHLQPQGIHHGGASEEVQGEHDVRLLEDIVDAGCAGSLLFSLFDEWFKVNWLVRKSEAPSDRDPMWHNLLDPEENYGLIGFDPPPAIRIDGAMDDWAGIAPYAHAPEGGDSTGSVALPLKALYVTSDQNRLYLRIDYSPTAWARKPGRAGETMQNRAGEAPPAPGGGVRAIGVSLDVLDPKRGDTRLPAPLGATWSRGAEFILLLEPPQPGGSAGALFRGGERSGGRAELFIDRSMNYSLYAGFLTWKGFEWNTAPFRPVLNSDGRYAPLVIEANRERIGQGGTVYQAQYLDWGRLSRGTEWEISRSGEMIEVAIPWGLLNVGDPSSHAVVDDKDGTRETEASKTNGMAFLAWATTAPGFAADSTGPNLPKAKSAIPAQAYFLGPLETSQVVEGKRVKIVTPTDSTYLWNGWDAPITKEHVKSSAARVRKAFEGMEAHEKSSTSTGERR